MMLTCARIARPRGTADERTVEIILETCLLSREEKIRACKTRR